MHPIHSKVGGEDYEVIVIDDGSSDGSETIIDKFKDQPNFKVVHKENGGVSSARNYGLEIATGEYVTFVDADDEVIPNSLTSVMPYFTSKSDIYIAGAIQEGQDTNLKIFDDVEFQGNNSKAALMFILTGGNQEKRIPKQATKFMSGCKEKFYRRDFVNSIGLRFDEELGRNEDVLWSCYAYDCANTIRFLPINVYINKEDENGITKGMNVHTFIQNMEKFIEKFNIYFCDKISEHTLADFYFQQSLITNYELYRAKKLKRITNDDFQKLIKRWYKSSANTFMFEHLKSSELPMTKKLAFYFMKLRLYDLVGAEMYVHHKGK